MHIYKTYLKVLLRNKVMVFWTLIFPIVLGTLFNLAFSNILASEKFKVVDIGIVNNEKYQNNSFKDVIDSISKEDDNQVFNVSYYDTEEDAIKELKDNSIIGYYIVNENIDMVVKTNGIGQTIMKYVSDDYYQKYTMIGNIYNLKPEALKEGLINNLETNNYLEEVSLNNLDASVIYFYSLIGMACLFGSFFGVEAVIQTEANLSKKGARINVAPTSKLKSLVSTLLAAFTIQFVEMIIFILFLLLVLGIDFGNNILLVFVTAFLGALAGITMGAVVGISNNKSENTKIALVISITMICSFLSGLMMEDLKYIIEKNIPFLARINPVAMISDGLYSLYYYDDLNRYTVNIISLVIFSLVMIFISYMVMRRKKYDSI